MFGQRASSQTVWSSSSLVTRLSRRTFSEPGARTFSHAAFGSPGLTMTDARHSSGYFDNGQMVYMGEPAGYVVRLEDGMAIYYAGYTCLFSDMRLIRELYHPAIAFLPIGDRFTMDPMQAAMACEF